MHDLIRASHNGALLFFFYRKKNVIHITYQYYSCGYLSLKNKKGLSVRLCLNHGGSKGEDCGHIKLI